MKFEVVIAIICMDITIHAKNIYCYEIAAIGIDLKDTDGGDFVTINVLSMNRDIHTDYSDNHFKFHCKFRDSNF
jgi:hypothetical protein